MLAHVTVNGPGIVVLRVRDGRGRTIAQTIAATAAAGTTAIGIPLTATGRGSLRRGRSIRVRVGHNFRDVLAARSRGTITGRLR